MPPHLRQAVALLATAALSLSFGSPVSAVSAAAPTQPAPSRDVHWEVDGVPEVADMVPTIRAVLQATHATFQGVDGQMVDGFFPGPTYTYSDPRSAPFYFYSRDTATILPMARFYFGLAAQRSAVEELLRLQYPDGAISATVSPDHQVDKATVTSDEETSLLLAAAAAFEVSPSKDWLLQSVRGVPLIVRLENAVNWLLGHRRDAATGLIWRGHTTDWGDIKWEASNDPTHLRSGDQLTTSIYDQSIAYAAMRSLARMETAAGRASQAADWEGQAALLRQATDDVLWQDQPDRGFYRIHVHVGPDHVLHDFDEGTVIAIGNAAAVYYGLASDEKVPRILDALERARISAGAPKVGLTLDPPYQWWQQNQMDPRVYQNGAIWDWWGGRQITGEFQRGYSAIAADHLFQVARDWATHPGEVREWESPWLGRTGRDPGYAGAAGVMGQAVVEGLFGVSWEGDDIGLTPRLGARAGSIRVAEPSSDRFVAYQYWPSTSGERVEYQTNSPRALAIRLPLLAAGSAAVQIDGKDAPPVGYEQVGADSFAVVVAPSGSHSVTLRLTPAS